MIFLETALASPPLQTIEHAAFEAACLQVKLLRLDTIHPVVNGNKWFKLKHNLLFAAGHSYKGILTFGGQYSNHIHAAAGAANLLGMQSVGIIAGANAHKLTPTLQFALEQNMQLHFVSRHTYRAKHEPEQIKEWQQLFPNYLIVPEGGTNLLAVKGTSEICTLIKEPFDYVVTACGTGGTLAGLANSVEKHQTAIGISVLKGDDLLTPAIETLIGSNKNFRVITGYHGGGYAKVSPELVCFIRTFYSQTGILLEQVYTAKMLMAVIDLAKQHFFKKNSTLVLLHTGGLQGLDTSIVSI